MQSPYVRSSFRNWHVRMRGVPLNGVSDTALLSEAALAEEWNGPEEDAARSHL